MEKMKINIGVVSDIVCPWCYIGKRRLERGMERASDRFDFEVEYFPFELNPHMPQAGTDFKEYLCKKFGSESKSRELTEHVRRAAAAEGIQFNLEMQHTRPNTRDVHRIIMFAREEGKQLEVVEGFFRAFFTDGIDLSRFENLIDIADRAGLDTDTIEALLNSNTGKLEIEMAEKELTDLGITSVPLYIIENKLAISGAQSVEAFTKAFEEGASVMAHPK
jgi:predicted DsbA family dithiol-disulfide isomerase